jgi:hypothetical protein
VSDRLIRFHFNSHPLFRLTRHNGDDHTPLEVFASRVRRGLPAAVLTGLSTLPAGDRSGQLQADCVVSLRVAVLAQLRLAARVLLAANVTADEQLAAVLQLSELDVSDPRPDRDFGAVWWLSCHHALVGADHALVEWFRTAARTASDDDDAGDDGEEDGYVASSFIC